MRVGLREAAVVGGVLIAVPAATVASLTASIGPLLAVVVTGAVVVLASPAWVVPLYGLAVALAEPAIEEVAGVAPAVVKTAMIALAGVAVLRCGLARLGRRELALFAVWFAALAWSLLSPDPYQLGLAGMLAAWLGFLAGWTFLLPGLDAGNRMLKALVFAPTVVAVLGVVLWPVLGRSPFDVDPSGLLRLQGLSIPPHLGMEAFVAIAAAVHALRVGALRRPYVWILINTAICVATLSRGGIAAVAVLLLFGVVLRPGPAAHRTAKYLTVLALTVVGAVAVVGALQRNVGNTYEGSFNTSGRLPAWNFFLSVAGRHPVAGNGLGASSVATATEAPLGVQQGFLAPHNEFIHFFVDLGWPAAALLLVAVAVLIGLSMARTAGRLEALGLLGGLAVLALLDNPLSTPSIPLMLALLLGVLRREPDKETHVEPTAAGDRAAARPERDAPARERGAQLPG